MKVQLTARGTRPLLLHNVQLASPLNPFSKRLKALNSKRIKTDEDRLEIAHTEWEGSFYYSKDDGPIIPGQNLYASLIEGARQTKNGKKIERGVQVLDLDLPLLYVGPRDLVSLWDNGESEFVDVRPVVVQRNKVDRCRPIFREWSVTASIEVDLSVIELSEFQRAATDAGAMAGLGDYRRAYGRYAVQVDEL